MSNMAEIDVLSELLRLIELTVRVPADQIDIDQNLESFGINSLIGMELMENIEKEFDVTITPAQFTNVDTVRALTGLLEQLVEEKATVVSTSQAAAIDRQLVTSKIQSASNAEQAAHIKPLESLVIDAVPRRTLDFVRHKYAIDLSYRGFSSLEDIADTLISGYSTDLMRYYGLSDQSVPHVPLPVNARLIAVVGMSCRLPDAPDSQAFWGNLMAGKNSMREIPKTRWSWQEHYSENITPGRTISKWGALIDNVDCFDANFFNISAEEAATLDPQLRLLIEETYHAVEDAGIDMKKLAGSRTGVFIGYEYSEYEHYLRKLNNKDFTKGPLFSSSSPSYYLSNRISHTFGLCGPSESINVNCASSAIAINRAYMSLLNGESDVAIAGAASLNLFADDYIAASQYGVLSPTGTCDVFDDDANGFTRGEGVATIVLKRLEDAEKSNDRIYCVIKSCHENYRGAARNISEVKHEAISNVLRECYEKVGAEPESIHYIEVDGYANKWADSFEYEGIKGVFGKSKVGQKHVALGSVKGNIGNVESVSGVVNVIKMALSMFHKKFPATISMKKINSFIDIDNATHPLYIANKEISFKSIRKDADEPIRAGVNSFADSGTNVHILLEEYFPERRATSDTVQSKELFVLSARDGKLLQNHVQQYIDFLSGSNISEPLADLVFTSQIGREALSERLAIVASSRKELLEKLSLVKKAGNKEKMGLESKDIYHGRINHTDKSFLPLLITADMAHMQLMESLRTRKWKQTALLWVNGVAVPWETIWQARPALRASMPTYPFAKDRHWLEVNVRNMPEAYVVSAQVDVQAKEEQIANQSVTAEEWYFYVPKDASVVTGDVTAMGRAEKIELFLRQEIARQLKNSVDEIARDKNFIDLGMNSIGVADLIIKTDKLLNTNLSPSVLFKHPAIGTLSEYLAETYVEAIDELVVSRTKPTAADVREPVASTDGKPVDYKAQMPLDILVPLQTKGERSVIFAVPGAGGSALSLQPLSHALGTEQPFYCFEPVGLDGKTVPMVSVPEIAEFNLEALRAVQAQGPYRLLGYSNGGIVAFEMTKRLLEQGEEVSSLFLLDSLSPPLLFNDPVEIMMVAVFKHFVSSLGVVFDLDVKRLEKVPENERGEYLYNCVVGLGIDLPKPQFMATFNVATASERGCRAYLPTRLMRKLNVVLIRAADSFKGARKDYGWNDFLSGAIQIQEIKGNHFSILEKGSAEEVAKRVNKLSGYAARGKAKRSLASN